MQTVALLDGDIFAYQAAAAAQTKHTFGDEVHYDVDEVKAKRVLLESLERIQKKLKQDTTVVCLSCSTETGWRRAIMPGYKAHRDPAAKPQLLGAMKDLLRNMHTTYERPTLEADDVMGILSTAAKGPFPGRKVIVSIDKDMKTIPGWLYNPDKDTKPRQFSVDEANYWHLYQTLVGDATDGYKGCPGIGPKRAEFMLQVRAEDRWPNVVAAFEVKGLTEEDALLQARVARICRVTDYDFDRKEVKLWTPSK